MRTPCRRTVEEKSAGVPRLRANRSVKRRRFSCAPLDSLKTVRHNAGGLPRSLNFSPAPFRSDSQGPPSRAHQAQKELARKNALKRVGAKRHFSPAPLARPRGRRAARIRRRAKLSRRDARYRFEAKRHFSLASFAARPKGRRAARNKCVKKWPGKTLCGGLPRSDISHQRHLAARPRGRRAACLRRRTKLTRRDAR